MAPVPNHSFLPLWLLFGSPLLGVLSSCSSVEVTPPPLPPVPEYIQVSHPETSDLSDLQQVVRDPECPQGEDFLKFCDLAFRQLQNSTVSKIERERGARELVKRNPVHYHWCFYRKLEGLETKLKDLALLEERQKETLTTYEFLAPIAQVFIQEYQDSRYLRFATARYQALSEWLFDKSLVLTPQGTVNLVQPENPFGLWKKEVTPLEKTSIIQKYNLVDPTEKPAPPPAQNPSAQNGSPESTLPSLPPTPATGSEKTELLPPI